MTSEYDKFLNGKFGLEDNSNQSIFYPSSDELEAIRQLESQNNYFWQSVEMVFPHLINVIWVWRSADNAIIINK